jgi:hypothetical protein
VKSVASDHAPKIDEKTAAVVHENDFSRAKLDVVVEVGPSSSTKRAATVRVLTKMASLTDDPETKQVLGSMAMMNMEGEGIADVRRYFRRKLIKMEVIKPNEQEQAELKLRASRISSPQLKTSTCKQLLVRRKRLVRRHRLTPSRARPMPTRCVLRPCRSCRASGQ